MKRVIPLILALAVPSFALPTLEGTRGTDFVSSALCEDMGYLWFYMVSGGYVAKVTHVDLSGNPEGESNLLTLQPAVLSIGFTPWHYLEFSAYGSGYFYFEQSSSAMAYGLTNVGGHVKGNLPFTDLDRPLVVATGIDGFFIMSLPFEIDQAADIRMDSILGFYPFDKTGPEFGAKLLFSLESKYISAHLNGGYWYRSRHTLGEEIVQYPQMIVGGVGLETFPLTWLNIFADFNLYYGLTMLDPDTLVGVSTYASTGVRIPFKFGPQWMLHLGGGADLRYFKLTSTLYAGLAVGGDLIIPKEKKIEGIVLNGETGKPIEGVRIELSGDFIDTVLYSDSLGHFILPELMEGDKILASKKGYHDEMISAEEVGDRITLMMDPIHESWVAGIVSDAETDEPLKAAVQFVALETSEIPTVVNSDPITGYFRTRIDPGNYQIITTSSNYRQDRRVISIPPENESIIDIFLKPLPKPEPPPELPPVTIGGFGRKEYGLSFYQMPELERVAELLEENPDATVVITGHTDSVGSDESNYHVGMKRARTVAEFLALQGIDARRIKVESGGERFPVADNRYRSGRAANRRVELYFSRDAGEFTSDGVTKQRIKPLGG